MATFQLPLWAKPSDVADLIRLSVPIAVSRMAMMLMGLTDAIVLGQFAPEELAFVLSAWLPIGVSLGFGIGILLGVLTTRAVAHFAGWDVMLTVESILLAAGFSCLIGVFFGFYPAQRAANLLPIQALRHE